MTSGLDAMNEQFLATLGDLQARINNAQNQISSGFRVLKASDAPQEIGDIFQSRADLARFNQIEQNLTMVKTQVDAADSSLQTAAQLMESARVLGAKGLNATATAEQQSALALQVAALLSQLVSLSRTEVSGVYIFSGDATGSPAYQVNPASPTGVDRLLITQATQQVEDPTGLTFQIAKTAQDLFDKRDNSDNPTTENAFAALHNLQVALESGNSNAISQAIDTLHTAGAYVNAQLGFYGSAQNRINSAVDLAKKFEVQAQTGLSRLQDADVAAAAVELTQANTHLNAAMAARAKRPMTTLFDYLR